MFNVYYIDASVLLENNQWRHLLLFASNLYNKKKITRDENDILLIRKILFPSLEDKIHIFAPPCNIFYLFYDIW